MLALCATTANAQIQWLDADVGGPTFKGSSVLNGDGTYTIQGGGSDIWNTSSQFHYLYGWATGPNWDISAQFQSFSGPANWSKVEFLVDQADTTVGPQGSDPFIAMMDTQPSTVTAPDGSGTGVNDGGIDQFRTAAGGNADWLQVGTTPAPAYPNDWFRIQRQTNIFNLYKSTNGVDWVLYISVDTSKSNLIGQDNSTHFGTAWPNIVAVGVAVTAHDDTWKDPATGLPAGSTAVVGNLQATFPPAVPPTLLAASQQIRSGVTNVLGGEASLSFAATNNAFPISAAYPVAYQWYKGATPVANATNNLYTWLLDTSDNKAQYHCHASLAAPYNSITLDSANATIGVLPGVYKTNGLKMEFWSFLATSPAPGVIDPRVMVETGDVGPATWLKVEPNADDPGGYGNYYAARVSGWFIAPTTDKYTFYVASDDDSDLFLSTDNTIANSRLIAQEVGWMNIDQWLTGGGGGGGASWTQNNSDTWSPDGGATIPYANGIQLNQGQAYFFQNVHYQGNGGDCMSVTYQTAAMKAAGDWATTFTNGTPSLLYGTNNNIMYATIAATYLTWVTQPTNATTTVGFPAQFYSLAASDSEFPVKYQWYKNGATLAGATAANLSTANAVAGDQGATFYVVATTAENEFSITSSPPATLNVALPVLEYGWAKIEYWYTVDPGLAPFYTSVTNTVGGITYITNILANYATAAPDDTIFEPIFEGNSKAQAPSIYTSRLSAYFYPPATDDYVFFVNSDDPGNLFVSTDSSPTNAMMVAQEQGWSASWQWTTANGGSAAQKRSDQWTDLAGNVPGQFGYHMIKGKQYYVALIHQDTGGGNNCEATFKSLSAPDPALGSYSMMKGSLISSYAPRCFSMSFPQQPGTVTAPLGGLATLTAVGATDSKSAIGDEYNPIPELTNYVVYQWTKNGVPIPGAVSSSYSFGPVSPQDSSINFACTIRALGYTDSGGNPLWATSTVANVVVSGTAVYEPGFALHEYWGLNPGVAAIESGAAGSPDWLMASPAFEVDTGAIEIADNFCDELVGFFIPPTSGNYVFFGNSDDNNDLFLSTDTSASSRRLIAQELNWSGGLAWGTDSANAPQTRSDTFVDPTTGITLYSNGIPLLAGQKYFMQQVHHQGGGGTWNGVNYELTSDSNYPNPPASGTVSAIRGSQVGTYVPKCSYVNVTTNPQPVTVNNYASATFTAGAATDSTVPVGPEGDWRPYFNNFLFFQWYKNGQAVTGANGPTYTIKEVLPSDNNSTIYAAMRALGYADNSGNALWTNSTAAVLTVITGAPPQLLYAAIYTNNTLGNPVTYVTLDFSTPMDPVALNNQLNYVLGGGLSIQSIMVNSNNYKNVVLTVTGTPSYPFTVTVNNTVALGGGLALSGSPTTAVNRVLLTDADIGTPPNDPGVPGVLYPSGTNAFTVECEGSDIWNAADGFNFAYEMKTGDFDVCVRQKDTTHTSNWAKGGLMVRETLDNNSRDWNIVNDPASADGIMAPDGSGYGANAIECNARVDTSGTSAAWTNDVPGYSPVSAVPAYPNAWVRLTRVGQLLSAYWSTNNAATWTLAATNSPAARSTLGLGDLPATVYVGICCTAHNNDAVGTPASQLKYMAYMDFDSFGAVPPPPPTVITISAPQRVGNNIVITWTPAVGHLWASPALTGPGVDWQQIGTGGSVSVPITGTGQFFRVISP
jgi:hypothetical protein